MSTIITPPGNVPRQVSISLSDPEASRTAVEELSLGSELESRFEIFVDELRGWYGNGVEDGALRLSSSRSSAGRRLDCWYQNSSPSWFDRTSAEPTHLTDSQLEAFNDSDAYVEVVSTSSGESITLTGVFTSGSRTVPKWGCWWEGLKTVSGDLWGYWSFDEADLFLISDGLGHGEEAAEPSRLAAASVTENGDSPVDFHLKEIHKKVQTTRGAVMFLGRRPVATDTLEFCSIGNISVKVIGDANDKSLVSFNGTVGFGDPPINVQTLSLDDVTQIVLHTDGIEPALSSFYDATFRNSSPVMNAARLFSEHALAQDDSLLSVVDV